MKKLIIILLSAAMLTATGCSISKPVAPTSSATESKTTAGKLDYEFYIESLNFYTDSLSDAFDKEATVMEKMNQAASEELPDTTELKSAYKACISALEDFSELTSPEGISEEHEELMAMVEKEKRSYELLLKNLDYADKHNNLTDAEKEELSAIQKELEELLSYEEGEPTLWDIINKAVNAALEFCK